MRLKSFTSSNGLFWNTTFFVRSHRLHSFLFSKSADSLAVCFKRKLCVGKNDASHTDEDKVRNTILSFAISPKEGIIFTHGWSVESLMVACVRLGMPGICHGLFPKAPLELVDFFLRKSREQLQQQAFLEPNLIRMNYRERLMTLLRMRLEMNAPYISNLSQALGLLLLPKNVPFALEALSTLIDDICHLAGDRSSDFQWYLKRVVLCGIYTSTELYMLTDATKDFSDTWQFLEKRLDDAIALQSTVYSMHECISSLFRLGFSAATDTSWKTDVHPITKEKITSHRSESV